MQWVGLGVDATRSAYRYNQAHIHIRHLKAILRERNPQEKESPEDMRFFRKPANPWELVRLLADQPGKALASPRSAEYIPSRKFAKKRAPLAGRLHGGQDSAPLT